MKASLKRAGGRESRTRGLKVGYSAYFPAIRELWSMYNEIGGRAGGSLAWSSEDDWAEESPDTVLEARFM